MKSKDNKELVEQYLLGLLSDAEGDAFEERLRADDDLMRELVSQSRADAALSRGLALLAEPQPEEVFVPAESGWRFPIYRFAAAALLVIALGGGWFALTHHTAPEPAKQPPTPIPLAMSDKTTAPKILDCSVQPDSKVVIRWAGSATGRSYRIETTTNLIEGFNEKLICGIPAVQPMNCYTVAVNHTASRYFRVVEERYQ
jgi:hypothetical protein